MYEANIEPSRGQGEAFEDRLTRYIGLRLFESKHEHFLAFNSNLSPVYRGNSYPLWPDSLCRWQSTCRVPTRRCVRRIEPPGRRIIAKGYKMTASTAAPRILGRKGYGSFEHDFHSYRTYLYKLSVWLGHRWALLAVSLCRFVAGHLSYHAHLPSSAIKKIPSSVQTTVNVNRALSFVFCGSKRKSFASSSTNPVHSRI